MCNSGCCVANGSTSIIFKQTLTSKANSSQFYKVSIKFYKVKFSLSRNIEAQILRLKKFEMFRLEIIAYASTRYQTEHLGSRGLTVIVLLNKICESTDFEAVKW